MEDKRKELMVAGLYLGDVTLVQAALAKDLPSYVEGFELERIIPDASELEPARTEVEALLRGRDKIDSVPPDLLRKILETAIEKGKFHSAARCLVMLEERDAYVDRYIAGAGEKLRAGDVAGAARDITIASNLGSQTGFPLFQYSGPEIHANCAASPAGCLTRAPADEAVEGALQYLLEGEKVLAFVGSLDAKERESLLPHIAMERDPHFRDFYAAFTEAHTKLGEFEAGALKALGEDAGQAADVVRSLASSLKSESVSPAKEGEGAGAALERAVRLANGFVKDFEDVDSLVGNLQLRRVKQRIINVMESENELRSVGEALGRAGSSAALEKAVALIEVFREKGILDRIDEIEAGLAGLQVCLLGRPVHSQEHWQFLRELAFKYPVSPVMCCIRKLNDRHMVVPVWDGHVTAVLRDFVERSPAPPGG